MYRVYTLKFKLPNIWSWIYPFRLTLLLSGELELYSQSVSWTHNQIHFFFKVTPGWFFMLRNRIHKENSKPYWLWGAELWLVWSTRESNIKWFNGHCSKRHTKYINSIFHDWFALESISLEISAIKVHEKYMNYTRIHNIIMICIYICKGNNHIPLHWFYSIHRLVHQYTAVSRPGNNSYYTLEFTLSSLSCVFFTYFSCLILSEHKNPQVQKSLCSTNRENASGARLLDIETIYHIVHVVINLASINK